MVQRETAIDLVEVKGKLVEAKHDLIYIALNKPQGYVTSCSQKGDKGDAVIALSSSGETSELADLVAYAKRFEIPLITMTRDKKSTLAKAADVALILPSSDEACPMGLAPTTSTTAMLALGDALAVALCHLQTQRFPPSEKKGVLA